MRSLIIATALASISVSAGAADTYEVAIKGGKFVPAALSVQAGDTVVFKNQGPAPHTATALDGSFDTGRLNKGQSAEVTISATGSFEYICEIHPAMKGSVVAK